MRGALAVALLVVPFLAGCTGDEGPAPAREAQPADVGYDPSTIHIQATRLDNVTIASFDGETQLSAAIRVPLSNDTLPDGSPPRWPVVILLHGWGGSKESYTGGRGGVPMLQLPTGTDRLQQFAEAGFLAVAYDARGFGQSTGHADVAGVGTMGDLSTVIDWVAATYPTSGRVGLLGQSYGAGQAYLAWARDARVTTAVAMYGWVDLGQALIPDDVPKLEWAQLLYASGLAGAHGRYHATIHDWYQQAYTRSDLDRVRAEMGERSAHAAMAGVDKPLLVCQGLQETLFPQVEAASLTGAGFTRTYVYTGGHGGGPDGCWDRALEWFHFFLAGFDTRVDSWPRLETVDALAAGTSSYAEWPASTPSALHLRAPDLAATPSAQTFTVRQSLSGGLNPSLVPDLVGGSRPPTPATPSDPATVTFTSAPFQAPRLVVGSPMLRLDVAAASPSFQVVAELVALRADGTVVSLGHAAAAALAPDPTPSAVELEFEWTHASLAAGDRLQVRVAPNDTGWWMPLLADYSVTFAGTSSLEVPFAA
jgi:predicted acyl esterase